MSEQKIFIPEFNKELILTKDTPITLYPTHWNRGYFEKEGLFESKFRAKKIGKFFDFDYKFQIESYEDICTKNINLSSKLIIDWFLESDVDFDLSLETLIKNYDDLVKINGGKKNNIYIIYGEYFNYEFDEYTVFTKKDFGISCHFIDFNFRDKQRITKSKEDRYNLFAESSKKASNKSQEIWSYAYDNMSLMTDDAIINRIPIAHYIKKGSSIKIIDLPFKDKSFKSKKHTLAGIEVDGDFLVIPAKELNYFTIDLKKLYGI